MTSLSAASAGSIGSAGPRDVAKVVAAAGAMFVILQGGLTLLVGRLDQTTSALLVTGTMLAAAFGIERLAYGRRPRAALAALGYGRPKAKAVLAASLIGGGMLAFFPIYAGVTGTALSLQPDWPWILLGAIVLNGIAEETLFRGFVFGHLRQAGHSFRRAGMISLVVFAAVHLFLFTANPPIVATLATILAIAAAFPFAFLFERAGGSIWAGVVLHVAAHAFRLVSAPADQTMALAMAWIVLQIGAMFLVFAFKGNLLRASGDAR